MSPLLRRADPDDRPVEPGREVGGREEAVPLLFRAHGAGLVRLGYALTGDRGAAEEAVQDAFVALYRNWDSLRDGRRPCRTCGPPWSTAAAPCTDSAPGRSRRRRS